MYFIFRQILKLCFKFYYNISFEGLENIPKEGGYIYASNHRSYADPVFIALNVPKKFSFMAKEELFKNFFFGRLIKLLGAFPVQRGKGDMEVINEAIKRLNKGSNLVIFPEGTRSKDGKVSRIKSGVALIAAKAGVNVIPVGIVFDDKLSFRKKVTIKYGKPISAKEIEFNENARTKDLKSIKNKIGSSLKYLVEGENLDVWD